MTTIEQAQRQAAERAVKRNPPAFPMQFSNGSHQSGLSIRDYFAAKAMQASMGTHQGDKVAAHLHARWAYEMADAMLTERNKP